MTVPFNKTPSYRREDVCVVAADGVGLAAVGGLHVQLLGLVVVGGALLLLLLLLLAVAVIALADPHHLHASLLPADDDWRRRPGVRRDVG